MAPSAEYPEWPSFADRPAERADSRLAPCLLSRELAARIDDYRRFRHAFRHMYFFDLDWARLRPLASGVPALLADFDQAVDVLFSQLGA